MLLAGGRLDGGDDLAGDAQLGERPERGLPVGPEVADGLEQADQALLLDVVGVATDEEVAAAPWPGRTPVADQEHVERSGVARPVAADQLVVAHAAVTGVSTVTGMGAAWLLRWQRRRRQARPRVNTTGASPL